LPTEKEVLEAFREFDRNCTGLLDVEKIQAVAEKMQVHLTNEEVRKIIEELDEDRDGYLNWVEFKNAVLE
jgi:Ca2+-binding EF-hand superfamily protein